MEFYYDGFLYTQRTYTSKIIKSKDGKVVEKYESKLDLPNEILDEYNLVKIMLETPENFFYYNVERDKVTINATISKNKSRNIVIPEYIDGKEVLNISTETVMFENVENVIFLCNARNFPVHLFNKNTNLSRIEFGPEMELTKGDFINKKNLKEIIISQKITQIPENFCVGCTNLEKINLENITQICNGAFIYCQKLNVKIPEKIEEIGIKAFYGSGIKNVIFPESLRSLGDFAFAECKKIESILNKSHIKIPSQTFKNANMSLEEIRTDFDR